MTVSQENPIHPPPHVDSDDNEKVNPSGSVWSGLGDIRIFSGVSPTAPTSPD